MARILSIYIDPETCTCSQACVFECPSVLDGETPDGVPIIREGAEKYFETHVQEIKAAAYVCPVEAITLQIEEDWRPPMDWTEQAKRLFNVPKPLHFTDYRHCCECAEHDQTLVAFDRDTIGLDQLGSAAWDPLCFSSPEGMMYYLPAMIRLTLDGIDNQPSAYLDQLLFHLIHDGENNRLVSACNTEQRKFVADFLAYLIDNHAQQIGETMFLSDDILRAHEIWGVD